MVAGPPTRAVPRRSRSPSLEPPLWQPVCTKPKTLLRSVNFLDIAPEDWTDQHVLAFETFVRSPTFDADQVAAIEAWFREIGRLPKSRWLPRHAARLPPAPANEDRTARIDPDRYPRHWAIAQAFSCRPINEAMKAVCTRFVAGVSGRAHEWARHNLLALDPGRRPTNDFLDDHARTIGDRLKETSPDLVKESVQKVAADLVQVGFFADFEPSLSFGRVRPLLEKFVANTGREAAMKEFKELVAKVTGGGRTGKTRPAGKRAIEKNAWRELLRQRPELLDELPAKERQAVALCDVQGLDSSAAEDQLGVRHGAVRTALARAHHRLRRIIEDSNPSHRTHRTSGIVANTAGNSSQRSPRRTAK